MRDYAVYQSSSIRLYTTTFQSAFFLFLALFLSFRSTPCTDAILCFPGSQLLLSFCSFATLYRRWSYEENGTWIPFFFNPASFHEFVFRNSRNNILLYGTGQGMSRCFLPYTWKMFLFRSAVKWTRFFRYFHDRRGGIEFSNLVVVTHSTRLLVCWLRIFRDILWQDNFI